MKTLLDVITYIFVYKEPTSYLKQHLNVLADRINASDKLILPYFS